MKKLALILLLFNSLGAIFGGGMLMYDTTGGSLSLPLSFLVNTPFSDFLIPGIILFLGNGVLCMLSAVHVFQNHAYSAYFIIAQGLFLSFWILIQIALIRTFYPPLHLTYLGIGILLSYLGIRMILKKI